MMNPPTPTVAQPKWDGKPSTFAAFRETMQNFLVRSRVAFAIPALNLTGYPTPTGAGSARETAIGESMAYVILADSVSETHRAALRVQYDQDKDAADQLGMNPVRMWEAIENYARGSAPDISGASLMRQVAAFRWPSGAGDGTYKDQVREAVKQLRSLHDQAELLRDPEYPFTEGLACAKFREFMPQRMQLDHAQYEQISRIHDLALRAEIDADRYDSQPQTMMAMMTPPVVTSQPAATTTVDNELLRALVASLNSPARSVGSSGPRFPRISSSRRMDKTAGPPLPDNLWCDHHGWARHVTAECKQRKSSSARGKVVRAVRNPDGSLTELTSAMATLTTMLKCGTNMCLQDVYVDSAAEHSLTNTLTGLRDVTKITDGQGPWFDGITDGPPIRATHRGTRPLKISGMTFLEPVWFAPGNRFNIASTEILASMGISTFVHADGAHHQLYLLLPDHSPVRCQKVGNIWQIPSAPTSAGQAPASRTLLTHTNNRSYAEAVAPALPATLPEDEDVDEAPWQIVGKRGKSSPAATPPATRQQPTKPAPAVVPYARFRAQIGNPSHRTTASTAKKLGIHLPNDPHAKTQLDDAGKLANQTARPLVSVQGASLEPEPVDVIVSDTIGTQFPLSAAGNRTLQSWVLRSDPACAYVTTGPNHTAANTVRGFQDFTQQAGIILHRNMINAGITVATDNGTEYLGEFAALLSQAGIHHATSTAHKKSGLTPLAEGANNRIQQRMRANMKLAAPNFNEFGLDVDDYWDFAATYGAAQDRATLMARRNPTTTYSALSRSVPAPFGAIGTVTLQAHCPTRRQQHKQLGDRACRGLLLDTKDHKCVMLLEDGRRMVTSDVHFSSTRDDDHADTTVTPTSTTTPDVPPTSTPTVAPTSTPSVAPTSTPYVASSATLSVAPTATPTPLQPPGTATGSDLQPPHTSGGAVPTGPMHMPSSAAGPTCGGAHTAQPSTVAPDTASTTSGGASTNSPVSMHTSSIGTIPVGTVIDSASSDGPHGSPDHTASAVMHDIHGHPVHVGDVLDITWPEHSEPHTATVTAIDSHCGQYTLRYSTDNVDLEHVHEIADVPHHNVAHHSDAYPTAHVALAAPRRGPSLAPHPSVAKYVNDSGDIHRHILLGHTSLPPQPAFPSLTQSSCGDPPQTVRQALASPHAIHYLHAIVAETRGHTQPPQRPPTYTLTTRRPTGRVLNTKWVFSIKFNGDTVIKFKARMCIAGFGLTQGVDFIENYTGTAPIGDLYLLESLATLYAMDVYEDDLTQAYCQVPMPPTPDGHDVIVAPSKGTRTYCPDSGNIEYLHIQMALYGHPVAGFALARGLHNRLLNRALEPDQLQCPFEFKQCPAQPVIFRARFDEQSEFHGGFFTVWINNDNIRTYASRDISQSAYAVFRRWLSDVFEITGHGVPLRQVAPQTCLGVEISYSPGRTQISMPAYIRRAIAMAGMQSCNPAPTPMVDGFQLNKMMGPTTDAERAETLAVVNKIFYEAITHQFGRQLTTWEQLVAYYAQHVSTIGWIAKQVAPVITLAHSIMGRAMSNPGVQAFRGLKRIFRYLQGHHNLALVYSCDQPLQWGSGAKPDFVMQSDASFADDQSDSKSQGGYLGRLAPGMAPCYWSSVKSQRVLTSTTEAETHHACKAAKHAVYVTQLLQFLDTYNDQPILLQLDSLSTVSTSGASIRKFTPKQKHFHIDDRYLTQCVEDGTILAEHVPGNPASLDLPGTGFPADALTKALDASLLRYYFPALQGPC